MEGKDLPSTQLNITYVDIDHILYTGAIYSGPWFHHEWLVAEVTQIILPRFPFDMYADDLRLISEQKG